MEKHLKSYFLLKVFKIGTKTIKKRVACALFLTTFYKKKRLFGPLEF